MKLFFIYRLFFITVFLSCTGCRNSGKRALPPLNENYRKTDKQPFGTFVAYNQFRHLFGDRYVEDITEPFDELWKNIKSYSTGKKYSLYFLVAKNLVLNYSEVKAFLDYVKAGNDLFISADYVDNRLLENINCNTDREGEITEELKGDMHKTHVNIFFGEDFTTPAYSYYYYPFLNALSGYDTAFTRVLGTNEISAPNYIVLFSGKGRIYLHVAPRIFGNYFLLTNDNYKYFENVISYLRSDPKNIYWDEYYKNSGSSRRRNNSNSVDDNFSSLNVIKQHPPLLWAFWIAVAGLLLFILFNIKRKQRIIPVIKPNVNTTVTFTETVGRLYLQKKDNRHIAEKMITYFYEHIRNKYFISTANIDDDFINSISGKSGFSKEKTQQLFALIQQIRSEENIEDTVLLKLNTEIENFTKVKN
ncbi:MAG TPA: DUF4350 domain-containing protein [Chitinophagaceae bacterium]|nr:DUF4350 domain-containing protein [Chitinophagaceae bacterium]